jgi:hypothetical protein
MTPLLWGQQHQLNDYASSTTAETLLQQGQQSPLQRWQRCLHINCNNTIITRAITSLRQVRLRIDDDDVAIATRVTTLEDGNNAIAMRATTPSQIKGNSTIVMRAMMPAWWRQGCLRINNGNDATVMRVTIAIATMAKPAHWQQQRHHDKCWGRCRHCSGNYEAWRASGGKYEAWIVIFWILAAVDFLRFLGKWKAVEENWKAIEESRKPLTKVGKPLKKIGFWARKIGFWARKISIFPKRFSSFWQFWGLVLLRDSLPGVRTDLLCWTQVLTTKIKSS